MLEAEQQQQQQQHHQHQLCPVNACQMQQQQF
jgi:hypothetical protein